MGHQGDSQHPRGRVTVAHSAFAPLFPKFGILSSEKLGRGEVEKRTAVKAETLIKLNLGPHYQERRDSMPENHQSLTGQRQPLQGPVLWHSR